MNYQHEDTQTLWLVRPGQTTWNAMGWVQGHVDGARFTRTGRREIRSAANELSEESVSAIYSSDLLRARRTAMAIAQQLKCDVRTDSRLRERHFGIAQGVPWSEVPTAATGVSSERVIDKMASPPGGESLHEVYLRCLDFLLDLEGGSHEGDVVLVAHEGSIRMIRAIVADEHLTSLKWETLPHDNVQPVVIRWPLRVVVAS